ncbi:MAG: hypothetical protein M3450_16785, partial [Actinomycetota bacterium]|nr:hypothetical protein [Actinomycetota bacterium]
MRRPTLTALAACFLAAMAAVAPIAASAQEPTPRPAVTAAVQVTGNPAPVRFHNTPQIARNPT